MMDETRHGEAAARTLAPGSSHGASHALTSSVQQIYELTTRDHDPQPTFLMTGTEPAPPPTNPEPARPTATTAAKRPAPAPRAISRWTLLHTASYLTLFAILGTLARLGLTALTTYRSSPLPASPVLWSNAAGSLLIGFLAADTALFAGGPRPRRKKAVPLYVGLATGFCGSLTSFSTFQRDVFLALTDAAPPSPNSARSTGQSAMAALASLILTPAVCCACLQAGAHLAAAARPWTPTLPAAFLARGLDRVVVPLAALAWLGAVLLTVWPPDRPGGPAAGAEADEHWRSVLFALVFAPPGCLLRWWLSLALNPRVPRFPLGTFAVNIGGTLLEALLWDLQHAPLPAAGLVGGGLVGCQVLQGAMDGFCGCLTTVSTWVAELDGLGRRRGYVYGAASLTAGLGATVAVMGGLKWTRGFAETACGAL